MLGVLSSLLGIGKLIKDFVVKNWKIALPLIAVLVIFFWTKEHYYKKGSEDTRVEWEARVKKETDKNEKLNNKLIASLEERNKQFLEDKSSRQQREKTHTERIETIIKQNPVYTQCVVDQAVLDSQNDLKGELR